MLPDPTNIRNKKKLMNLNATSVFYDLKVPSFFFLSEVEIYLPWLSDVTDFFLVCTYWIGFCRYNIARLDICHSSSWPYGKQIWDSFPRRYSHHTFPIKTNNVFIASIILLTKFVHVFTMENVHCNRNVDESDAIKNDCIISIF